jgi:hypothetical protein
LEHTREAISNDREIGQAQVRAYLTITYAGGWLIENDGVCIVLNLENHGNSPARDVHCVFELLCAIPFKDDRLPPGDDYEEPVRFYTPTWVIGDMTGGHREEVGPIAFRDLSIPHNVIRDAEGRPRIGLGQVAVFASDVFDVEIFETSDMFIFPARSKHDDFRSAKGNTILPNFREDRVIREKGWEHHFRRGKPKRRNNA